jgi:hypothetical protein
VVDESEAHTPEEAARVAELADEEDANSLLADNTSSTSSVEEEEQQIAAPAGGRAKGRGRGRGRGGRGGWVVSAGTRGEAAESHRCDRKSVCPCAVYRLVLLWCVVARAGLSQVCTF